MTTYSKTTTMTIKHSALALFGAHLLCGCNPAPYSTRYNLDFEYAKNDTMLTQWQIRNPSVTRYILSLDREVKRHGNASLKAQRDERLTNEGITSWCGFQSFLPEALVAGRELQGSGWVRTKEGANVCAGYGVFAYVPGKTQIGFLSDIDRSAGCGAPRSGHVTRYAARSTRMPPA